MDALATSRRNIRWSRDPIVDHGEPVVAYLTERDIEIFRLLARYRYLRSDEIHAFVRGKLTPLIRRLNLLSRKPNLYINRPLQQRQSADANNRPLIYELDDRGCQSLHERGLPFLSKSVQRNFAHEVMVCRIMASIELGARDDPAIRIISWSEILASEKTPIKTRISSRPERVPVSYEHHGEQHSIEVSADGAPFGIERTRAGERSYLFFPGIEADCGTEPLESNNLERSSIYKKFVAYRAVVAANAHQTHFGFPNFFVPFVAGSKTRMASMMKLLDRLTEGRGSKMFLFKTFPAFNSPEKSPAPTGHLLRDPWQRVGFDPLDMTG